MNNNDIKDLEDNDELRKRLAKLVAHDCFRNTKLEHFHAAPESRLSDVEMKELMIDVVNHTYGFINQLFGLGGERIVQRLKSGDPVPEWDEPQLPT